MAHSVVCLCRRKKAHASLLHGVIHVKALPAGQVPGDLYLQIACKVASRNLKLTPALIWELAAVLGTAARQWMSTAPGASLREAAAAQIAIPAEKLGPCFCPSVQVGSRASSWLHECGKWSSFVVCTESDQESSSPTLVQLLPRKACRVLLLPNCCSW